MAYKILYKLKNIFHIYYYFRGPQRACPGPRVWFNHNPLLLYLLKYILNINYIVQKKTKLRSGHKNDRTQAQSRLEKALLILFGEPRATLQRPGSKASSHPPSLSTPLDVKMAFSHPSSNVESRRSSLWGELLTLTHQIRRRDSVYKFYKFKILKGMIIKYIKK